MLFTNKSNFGNWLDSLQIRINNVQAEQQRHIITPHAQVKPALLRSKQTRYWQTKYSIIQTGQPIIINNSLVPHHFLPKLTQTTSSKIFNFHVLRAKGRCFTRPHGYLHYAEIISKSASPNTSRLGNLFMGWRTKFSFE